MTMKMAKTMMMITTMMTVKIMMTTSLVSDTQRFKRYTCYIGGSKYFLAVNGQISQK